MSTLSAYLKHAAGSEYCLDADTLFGQASQLTIHHAGEVYVLSKTRQNKLLLTKPELTVLPMQTNNSMTAVSDNLSKQNHDLIAPVVPIPSCTNADSEYNSQAEDGNPQQEHPHD